jgi:glycosyltransferase involved in cell wall biosynthesis
MRPRRIVVAAVQVPFVWGGAEWHAQALRESLVAHGFDVDLVQLPFQWSPKEAAFHSALAWRFLDLTQSNGQPIDLLIATRFPSYIARHPRKVVWLFHQFRQAYDLHDAGVDGFSGTTEGDVLRRHFIDLDNRALRECRRIYTTSSNNAKRMQKYNGLTPEILRLPLLEPETWRCEAYEDFILSVGRLERLKRPDLIVRAAAHLPATMKVVVVGRGPLENDLRRQAEALGVVDRVILRGFVEEAELKRLYARCGAVFYAPFDEDYGLVTLEAFHSHKPVVTTDDAGGPLEFVRHEATGLVAASDPESVALHAARLIHDKKLARQLGDRGFETVRHIRWDEVVRQLASLELEDTAAEG